MTNNLQLVSSVSISVSIKTGKFDGDNDSREKLSLFAAMTCVGQNICQNSVMDTTKLLTELDAIAKRIENLRRLLVKQQPQLPATVQAKVDAKLCVYCGDPLGKKRSTRGAHEKCYRTAMRRIEKAQTTDEELVAEGLLLPQERQGRKPAKNDPVLELRRQDSERAATGLSTAANPSVSKTSKTK